MEENKRHKAEQKQRELEEDNKPPSGKDLMYHIYQDKVHASYAKREKNDKIVDYMKDKIESGVTHQRIVKEQQSLENY